jgi:hypothetical protein
MPKIDTHFVVTYGKPFKNFRQVYVYVSESDWDDQPGHVSLPSVVQAERYARALAKEKKGMVEKLTSTVVYDGSKNDRRPQPARRKSRTPNRPAGRRRSGKLR